MLEIALNIQVKQKDRKKVLGHPWIWKQYVWDCLLHFLPMFPFPPLAFFGRGILPFSN